MSLLAALAAFICHGCELSTEKGGGLFCLWKNQVNS